MAIDDLITSLQLTITKRIIMIFEINVELQHFYWTLKKRRKALKSRRRIDVEISTVPAG